MSFELLLNVVVALAVVGYIASRQLRWRRIDRAGVWKMPGILGIIGLFSLSQSASKLSGGGLSGGGLSVGALDVGLIAFELALSVGIGLLMGRMTVFRTASPDEKGRTIEARTGGHGAALWFVMIAVRIGVDVAGSALGAHLVTATGVILLTIAANRAASALMMDSRLPRTTAVKA